MTWSERFNMRKFVTFLWPFPTFGWKDLSFEDKFKLFALYVQLGAGIAMTAFAAFAMLMLAAKGAVWQLFWIGMAAMAMIGIVVTGLASLLIKRNLEVEAGILKIKANDAQVAKDVARSMTQNPPPPSGE